ncbi:putative transcriptional regulator [Thalassobacillus devorans]|uniref:Transcriptional regulator n=1 Tax=Thalassobacillus devorans TaxID=279813 RepID=A0ABQ1NUQ7_9BACI|nr:ROK family protein [Thalassobacillus devorans]NIK28577.1 putative NBD/HSP70 family sugar kinase [Thalassobacillus devorans]GGC85136.1 putative transcriptional regulator [Thalassobacillus devorans]
MTYLLAMDIGGTRTKFGLISNDSKLSTQTVIQTPGSFFELYATLDAYLKKQDQTIHGIAVSSPGSITDSGAVLGYSAVPFLHEVNLLERLHEHYCLPVSVENDANCAALAEKWNGAATNLRTYACIVCGTGIGGAIVMDDHLWKGANLHGGEFGYAIMESDRSTSRLSTWSDLGSSSAISRRLDEVSPGNEQWTGEQAFAAVSQGHKEAKRSIATFFHYLGVGVFNIQYIVDPEKILIGGGITRQPDFLPLLDEAIGSIHSRLPYAKVRPDIGLCHHLADAQLIGAAYVWNKKYRECDQHV